MTQELGESVFEDGFNQVFESATKEFNEKMGKLFLEFKAQGDIYVEEQIKSLNKYKWVDEEEEDFPGEKGTNDTEVPLCSLSPAATAPSEPVTAPSEPVVTTTAVAQEKQTNKEDCSVVYPLSNPPCKSPELNPVATSTPKKDDLHVNQDLKPAPSKPKASRVLVPPQKPAEKKVQPQPHAPPSQTAEKKPEIKVQHQSRAPPSQAGQRRPLPPPPPRPVSGNPGPSRGFRSNYNPPRATSMLADEWDQEDAATGGSSPQLSEDQQYTNIKYVDPSAKLYVKPS